MGCAQGCSQLGAELKLERTRCVTAKCRRAHRPRCGGLSMILARSQAIAVERSESGRHEGVSGDDIGWLRNHAGSHQSFERGLGDAGALGEH